MTDRILELELGVGVDRVLPAHRYGADLARRQSQVRYTVLGLRGDRTSRGARRRPGRGAVSAHVRGPRSRPAVDARRDRPGRGVAAVARAQAAAARCRARARPRRGRHGRHGALDRDAAPAAGARRLPAHRVPDRAQLVFDAGSTRRSTASWPSAAPCAIGWSPTASRQRRSRSSTKGVDVERIVALPHGNLHAALFLPTHSPIVGTIGALVAQKDHHTPDRRRGARRQAGVRRQVRHPRRGRAAAAAREADQAPAPRASCVPGRLSRRRARAAEGRRRVRAQLDARGHVHVARRRDGRRKACRGDRRRRRPGSRGGRRKRASWCRRAIRRRWPRASSSC